MTDAPTPKTLLSQEEAEQLLQLLKEQGYVVSVPHKQVIFADELAATKDPDEEWLREVIYKGDEALQVDFKWAIDKPDLKWDELAKDCAAIANTIAYHSALRGKNGYLVLGISDKNARGKQQGVRFNLGKKDLKSVKQEYTKHLNNRTEPGINISFKELSLSHANLPDKCWVIVIHPPDLFPVVVDSTVWIRFGGNEPQSRHAKREEIYRLFNLNTNYHLLLAEQLTHRDPDKRIQGVKALIETKFPDSGNEYLTHLLVGMLDDDHKDTIIAVMNAIGKVDDNNDLILAIPKLLSRCQPNPQLDDLGMQELEAALIALSRCATPNEIQALREITNKFSVVDIVDTEKSEFGFPDLHDRVNTKIDQILLSHESDKEQAIEKIKSQASQERVSRLKDIQIWVDKCIEKIEKRFKKDNEDSEYP